jgi:hypothetical protein
LSLVPFDPNGMVMDLLRSCYRRPIRYVAGDVSITSPATWFFAKETALPFPGPHSFGSQNWDSDHPFDPAIGEKGSSKGTYYNGRPLNRSDGRNFAGPKGFFLAGCDTPANLPRGTDATPLICLERPLGKMAGGFGVPVALGSGGKRVAGTSTTSTPLPPPGTPCTNCPPLYTPSYVPLTIAGATGPQAVFNGTWNVPQISPCTWFLNIGGSNQITIGRLFGGQWSVNCTDFPTTFSPFYVSATPDCQSLAVIPYSFGILGGMPLSVQVF